MSPKPKAASPRVPSFPRIPLHQAGFTLIEIVTVIVILGIVGMLSLVFIRYTVEGYDAQTRRAALVDNTTLVLSRMARDIRAALPNSVRVTTSGNRTAIEMVHVAVGARYRDGPGPDHNGNDAVLKFNKADDQFNVIPALADPLPTGTRAVIYNVGISGADAYENANVITPDSTSVTAASDGNESRIALSSGFHFQYRSPNQRIYFVDGPISYVCNTTSKTLTRYSGYSIMKAQPLTDGDFGIPGALAAQDVAKCNFIYEPGTSQRAGVATLRLTLTRNGESVHLLQQVHVINAP